MILKRSCEECPLVKGCEETAALFRGFAAYREEEIKKERQIPGQILAKADKMKIGIDERLTELTFDYVADMDPEDAATYLKAKNQREADFKTFQEIKLYEESLAQIEAIKEVHAAQEEMASASEEYAAELQANCKKGVGKIRSFGLVGTQHLFCRSGGVSPNLNSFASTERYKELVEKIDPRKKTT